MAMVLPDKQIGINRSSAAVIANVRQEGRLLAALARAVWFFYLASLVAAVLAPQAQAKEVCATTASKIDFTLCEQPALKVLLDSLARSADRMQHNCETKAFKIVGRPRPHVQWLSDVTAEINGLKVGTAQDYLGSTFTQRADELDEAHLSCVQQPGRAAGQVRIDTVQLLKASGQDEASSLPYVQTEPALVGRRINDALYAELLGNEPPLSAKAEDVRNALSRIPASSTEEPETNQTLQVSVLSRGPRLLLLQVNTSGCANRCWQNSEQRLFDLRTGYRVEPVDLLSSGGRRSLNLFAERIVLQAALDLRRLNKVQWTPEGLEAYDRCIAEWRGWQSTDGNQIVWLRDNRWHVIGPNCSGDGDVMPASIVSKTFPVASLSPYLSAYGKSLILNSGDVYTPAPQLAACSVQSVPPDPQGWAERVKEISVGADHTFLREASGRVWGWGRSHDGALGDGNKADGSGNWIPPFVFGDGYLYAGAGQGFSATLRGDGLLSTWGSGYNGKLGDGASGRPRPTVIGQDFAQVDVDNYGGRALGTDGRLWAWGGSERPRLQVVAKDVAQLSGSIPVLVLQRDGVLLATNEWQWLPPGQAAATPDALHRHGTGFARLPRARNLQLAWRADGSAWAWGQTLSAMATPKNLPGLEQSPWPRLVGREWVDVKASHNSTLVAARKSDGSLWVSQERGRTVRMERVGCGFADMVFAYDENRAIHLLALRSDGSLLDYQSSNGAGSNVRRDLLAREPKVLKKNGVKLFLENDYWGNVGGTVLLLRQDGTLWQWYWQFGGQYPKEGVPSDQWLRKIDFPDAWFQGRGLKQ